MNSFLTFSQFSSLVILFSISNGFLFKHFWPNIQFNIVLLIGPYQDNTLADGWLNIRFLIAIYWADILIECNSTKIGLTQQKTESYVGPKYWAWQGLLSVRIYFIHILRTCICILESNSPCYSSLNVLYELLHLL